ncbi:MAG: glycosyltransferase [Bacteroidota bacterium]
MTHISTPGKNILVAPLNWGLGHATRCIPIINALLKNNYNPIIASDGIALDLLRKEFPQLQTIELASYQIEYPKNGKNFKLKMLANSPKMVKAILTEKNQVRKIIKEHSIEGIISDNRLGVRSSKVPSVFITHQLKVMTGNTTWLSTKLHSYVIKKFDECWVPDVNSIPNLSGKLGHLDREEKNIRYIGPLSRLKKKNFENKYDLMVIISGPEPQRTLLEEKLITELSLYQGNVLFIKGKIEPEQIVEKTEQFTFYNYMNSEQLEVAFNESKIILCRSGYTTIMDLAYLEKKAFFIPTPGQYEQEYLAKKFKNEGLAPSCKQDKFKLSKLDKLGLYRGFSNIETTVKWKELFEIFK